MVAASALFHLREHLPPSNALTRTEVERLCADYGVLGDIVNASKHSSISNPTPHGSPLVTSAIHIHEEIVITDYKDQEGIYRFIEKQVVAELADGTRRNVLEVLTNVMNFWQAHLHSLGVISKPRTYTFDSNQQPKSRAECGASRLNFEAVQGLRFRQSMRLQRYNYETHTIEPIDLTGAKANFRAYRQRYDVDVSLIHEETGVEFKKTITLSDEESQIYAALRTEAERQTYLSGLPCTQEALQQLAVEAGLISKSNSDAGKSDEDTV